MEPTAPRPLLRAAAWLALLAPLFFLTYNAANSYAASLPHVPSIVFPWEQHLPFLAWTILPYWSSDLLYALSFALCRTKAELDRHALRLLVIQLFSITCFVLFPLRLTLVHPPITGPAAILFDALATFDKPFNQAPSLHVSLALILCVFYRQLLTGWARHFAAIWFLLIGLSASTTWQHHFIDLPTGLWAALLVLAAIPNHTTAESRRPKLAALYLLPSLALTTAAFLWGGPFWLALWPAFSLSMVACAYWTGNPTWLSKHNGRIAIWMWPYTLCAWINSRCWTRNDPQWQHLADGVWIGRAPSPGAPFATIIDLTAEMPIRAHHHIPILDLTTPTTAQVTTAVTAILSAPRPALVCCALGFSRSATIAAAWLIAAGHANSAEQAIDTVRRARPRVILGKEALHRVQSCTR